MEPLAWLSRFDFLLPEARLTSALRLLETVLHNWGNGSVRPSAHGNDKHVDWLSVFELWNQHDG
jgi:hypothetical protein